VITTAICSGSGKSNKPKQILTSLYGISTDEYCWTCNLSASARNSCTKRGNRYQIEEEEYRAPYPERYVKRHLKITHRKIYRLVTPFKTSS
jgi:hypothetical protein